jgi:hypothetical protein
MTTADDEDDFDYAPILEEVKRRSAELDMRARHPEPWLTTRQFLEGIQAPERDECANGLRSCSQN